MGCKSLLHAGEQEHGRIDHRRRREVLRAGAALAAAAMFAGSRPDAMRRDSAPDSSPPDARLLPGFRVRKGQDQRRDAAYRHRRQWPAAAADPWRAADSPVLVPRRAGTGEAASPSSPRTCAATATAASRRTAKTTSTIPSARWRRTRSN